jgi:hypothetical protein
MGKLTIGYGNNFHLISQSSVVIGNQKVKGGRGVGLNKMRHQDHAFVKENTVPFLRKD